MANYNYILLLCLLAFSCSLALALEPSPLQDFCVADSESSSAAFVNGIVCKDPKLAQATDFFFTGLHIPGNTSNTQGSKVTPVNVAQLPGLNTLGISMARVDYAPWGINPPHTHPRASEILTVLEGTLHVGFVTSNPDNRLITKVLQKGDVFVFPMGLVHFQRNVGYGNAVAIAALSSQNPGVITIANAVFGSNPAIGSEVLTKAFQVDKNISVFLMRLIQKTRGISLVKELNSVLDHRAPSKESSILMALACCSYHLLIMFATFLLA